MTDADELAHLRAICEAPDDDLPRLVFADRLDERGGPGDTELAAFIRGQCGRAAAMADAEQAARADGHPLGMVPEAAVCWGHELAAWPAAEAALGRTLPPGLEGLRLYHVPAVSGAGYHGVVRRGLLDSLVLSARDWVSYGDALLARHPVREVRLTGVEPDVGDDGMGVWIRAEADPTGERSELPAEVWHLLPPGVADEAGEAIGVKWHPTAAEARDALRSALAARWPRVKTWRLPTPTGVENPGSPVIDPETGRDLTVYRG